MSRVSSWMDRNLATQGYRLTPEERRRLRLGLQFPTGLCLPLVVTGLALESPVILVALSGIGLAAGFTPRHPFDLLWNHGVRHLLRAPALPPNPVRRRHAFKFGTVCPLAVAALFASGLTTAALAVGGLLVAACGLVTTTGFCVPSFLLSLLEHRRGRPAVPRPDMTEEGWRCWSREKSTCSPRLVGGAVDARVLRRPLPAGSLGHGTGGPCASRSGASTGQGTETSPVWTAYMEGLVRAGERAAAEVLAALGESAGEEPLAAAV